MTGRSSGRIRIPRGSRSPQARTFDQSERALAKKQTQLWWLNRSSRGCSSTSKGLADQGGVKEVKFACSDFHTLRQGARSRNLPGFKAAGNSNGMSPKGGQPRVSHWLLKTSKSHTRASLNILSMMRHVRLQAEEPAEEMVELIEGRPAWVESFKPSPLLAGSGMPRGKAQQECEPIYGKHARS